MSIIFKRQVIVINFPRTAINVILSCVTDTNPIFQSTESHDMPCSSSKTSSNFIKNQIKSLLNLCRETVHPVLYYLLYLQTST